MNGDHSPAFVSRAAGSAQICSICSVAEPAAEETNAREWAFLLLVLQLVSSNGCCCDRRWRAVPPRSAGAGAGWPPTPPEEERERRARRPSGNPRAADSSLLLRSPQEEERVPQPELSLRRRGHEPADPRSDAGGAGEGGRLGPFLVPDGDDAVAQMTVIDRCYEAAGLPIRGLDL